MPADTAPGSPRYPVTEIASNIAGERFGKMARSGEASPSSARISARPNPMAGRTEVRFSIPSDAYVTVRVLNQAGREVLRPVDRAWTEAGRYAIEIDGSTLQVGTYIVSFDAEENHAAVKLSVLR